MNAVPVAIPDAFFKIVIKENRVPGMANRPDVLAFIHPNRAIPKTAINQGK